MAGLKFYYSYMSSDSKLNYIEIRDRDLDTDDDAIEVTPSVPPFVVEYPEVEMTDVLRGSGATLSFIYKGDNETLREFYTVDSKKYTVYQYIDGVVNWIGYLDSELYEEDFSTDTENVGVELSIGANNGFALLERLPYYKTVDSSGAYTFSSGQVSLLTLILDCIDFMGLDYENIYISSKTTTSNTLIENVLSDTYIAYNNFIDEDGEPMYCKDVIVGILAIYGLHFKAIGVNIFIEDGESQLDTLTTYTTYDIATRVKVSGTTLGDIVIVENLYNIENGASLTYDTIVNSQTVTADTYILEYLVDIDLSNDFEDNVGTYVSTYNGTTDDSGSSLDDEYEWTEKEYNGHSSISITDTSHVSVCSVEEGEDLDEDYYIKIELSDTLCSNESELLKFYPTTNSIIGAEKIKISFDYMFRKSDAYLDEDNDPDKINLSTFALKIQIGIYTCYCYTGALESEGIDSISGIVFSQKYQWTDESTNPRTNYDNYIKIQDFSETSSNKFDNWTSYQNTTYDSTEYEYSTGDLEIIIPSKAIGEPVVTLLSSMDVYEDFKRYEDSATKYSLDGVELRIKDFQIEFIDDDYDSDDIEDIEYEGDANVLAKDEGSGVTCICNTGYHPEDEFNYRGIPNLSQLYYLDNGVYKGVKYFSRGVNNGDNRLLEELLLAHLLGNTSVKREKLTLTCDYDGFNILSKLTSNYIPGVTMVVRGCTIDYQQNSMELIMCSLLNDSEI